MKSLPVVAGGRVVEMVSRRDIIKVLARQDLLVEAEVDDALRSAAVRCSLTVVDGIVRVEAPPDPQLRETIRALTARVPGVVAVAFEAPGGRLSSA